MMIFSIVTANFIATQQDFLHSRRTKVQIKIPIMVHRPASNYRAPRKIRHPWGLAQVSYNLIVILTGHF